LDTNIQDKVWNYSNKNIKHLINLFRYTYEHSSNYFQRTINLSKDIIINEFQIKTSNTEVANIDTELIAEYSNYQVFCLYANSNSELIMSQC
jgi:hypothetical protein